MKQKKVKRRRRPFFSYSSPKLVVEILSNLIYLEDELRARLLCRAFKDAAMLTLSLDTLHMSHFQ